MEIVYNQFYKSGAKGTAFGREKDATIEFLENDNEHHDIGFKEADERTAKRCVQVLRGFLAKKFEGGGTRLAICTA